MTSEPGSPPPAAAGAAGGFHRRRRGGKARAAAGSGRAESGRGPPTECVRRLAAGTGLSLGQRRGGCTPRSTCIILRFDPHGMMAGALARPRLPCSQADSDSEGRDEPAGAGTAVDRPSHPEIPFRPGPPGTPRGHIMARMPALAAGCPSRASLWLGQPPPWCHDASDWPP